MWIGGITAADPKFSCVISIAVSGVAVGFPPSYLAIIGAG
jgi:hypothetical protein